MTITEIITEFGNRSKIELQLSKRNGLLTSTWLLYKRKGFYYYFDINQKIEFIDRFKYTAEELEKEFENSYYTVEDIMD